MKKMNSLEKIKELSRLELDCITKEELNNIKEDLIVARFFKRLCKTSAAFYSDANKKFYVSSSYYILNEMERKVLAKWLNKKTFNWE